MQKHPNFPDGKGIWIWMLSQCEGGNLDKIIQRCLNKDISYVIIKAGDGQNTWAQFNKNLVDRFHDAGIKIYSWTYVYGIDPTREAQVAMWALDMGVDGHVFDAEGEYERIANPGGTAEIMLKLVRLHSPQAFLAHAPFPFIDSHKAFPYIEFGKYCDAVMPQMYWGTIYRQDVQNKPTRMIMDTYNQWEKWEKTWAANGHGDSIKPIIPLGQFYDNKETNFILTGSEVKEFMDGVKGYGSVNFWDYQHMLREDIWNVVRDTKFGTPVATDTNVAPQTAQFSESDLQLIAQLRLTHEGYSTWNDVEMLADFRDGHGGDKLTKPVVFEEISTPTPQETPEVVPDPVMTPPVETPVEQLIDDTPKTPDNVNLSEGKTEIKVPKGETVSVKVQSNGDIKVDYHQTHLDYFLHFIDFVLRLLRIRK